MDRMDGWSWRQAGSAAVRRIPGPFATVVFSNNITVSTLHTSRLSIIPLSITVHQVQKEGEGYYY